MRKFLTAVMAAVFLCPLVKAEAHGGGGGGSRIVYIPVFVPGGPSFVPGALNGDYSHIHTVAIVSSIGQTMTLGQAGWLVDHSTVDISDLGLDDFVAATLKQYLAARFTFVDVPYDRAKLAKVSNGINDLPTFNYGSYLAGVPANGLDAFIVVRADAEGGGPTTPGLSLNDSDGARPGLRANFEIDIVDAKTGKRIGHVLSRIQLRNGAGASFAGIYGPPELKIAPNQVPTPEQRGALKVYYQKLLGNALIETVRPLNLGVALPDPGARVMIPIPEAVRPKVRSVAVVSAVGDTLVLDHRGAFFAHDAGTAPIADWKIDSEIEAMVASALDKRIAVKPVVADRARIGAQTFAVPQDALHAPVDGLTESDAVDAYLVVVKIKTYSPLYGLEGPGLALQHITPMGEDQTTAYGALAIMVVDPKTLRPVVIVRLAASPAKPTEQLVEKVDNTLWPEKMTFAAGQSEALHRIFHDTLADAIPETLMRMHLTAMIPSGQMPPSPERTSAAAPGTPTAN